MTGAQRLAIAGALAAAFATWLGLGNRTPLPTRIALPQQARHHAADVTFTSAARSVPAAAERALDAEQLLRQLEPLASTDKPRALGLALRADEALPDTGIFAEARRALIVTLLVDLARMADARERARAFLASYPESRYVPLVQGVTGIHPRPRPSQLRDARP